MHAITTRKFRQFVLGKYPALAGSEPFLRFFHYLCFSTFFDRDTHQLVMPTRTMAEDFCQASYNSSFNGLATLEEFRDKVLPGLTWASHEPMSAHSWKGKARQIINPGFDQEMQEALRREWQDTTENRVEFITGRDHRRGDRYREAKKTTAQYEKELAGVSLNPTQSNILNYLRQIGGGRLFLPKLDDNKEAIEKAIGTLKPHVQDIRYRILAAVRHNPKVYYRPSGKGHTCRLSPGGDSILGLKKEVRKAATKGWWECDLRSSQFAILAAKLNAPLSLAFIETGMSVWQEFNLFLFGADTEPTPDLKKVMKEAIYSLCFGKGKVKLREAIEPYGVSRLLKHPILKELFSLRTEWFKRIEEEGGALDVWGEWHPVSNERWAGKIAGTVIQSVEMEIISPIFEVANKSEKSDQFRITLFQHDGGTISFGNPDKIPRAQDKLKKAVEARARALGVSTVLEFTQL